MKKNYLFGLFALATMLFTASSCQEEDIAGINAGNSDVVTFAVNMKQTATTRAAALAGRGAQADKLYYGVYEKTAEGWALIPAISATTDETLEDKAPASITFNKPTQVEIKLAKQKEYSVIFWATNEANDVCNVNWANRTMTMKTTGATANNEANDAFWAYETVVLNGAVAKTVDLYRPFAQLNIGVSDEDYQAAIDASVELKNSAVTVKKVPTTMNLADGTVSGLTETSAVAYDSAAIPTSTDWTFPVSGNKYLALNYVLVGGTDQSLIDVELSYTDKENGSYSSTFTSVPVRRNYRTNIYGNLLTNDADYSVKIEAGLDGEPGHDVYVWDGEEVSAPLPSAEDENIYKIEYASELAWLAAAVNGSLEESTRAAVAANDFAGKTFVLTEDIDLGGKEWTPIGSPDRIFKGTFDGQGYTIKNLVITGNNQNVGLFGVTHDGEIKNFTVENAKVSGRLNVGVVAGQPYTSKYTDITVKGHVEVNGMAYVGGVGGKDAYADWTNIAVDVDETSYVKANSVENGKAYRTYVGGVVGFNGEGGHTFKNITSNINVEGSTIDVGGLFGIAHYGNKFENCACAGNVVNTTDEAENAIEMGGIAGVWHNGGENVEFTNCSFTGTLSAPNAGDVNFYYNGLVGAPYSTTGTGKLIINGKYYVASAAELQAAVNAATGESAIYLAHDIDGNVTVVQKQGVKITIDGENKKFNGSIKVHSNSNHYADAALTVKNVNFESSVASVNFIEALENGAERYSTNITVKDCTFTATGEGENTSVGVQIKASKKAKVLNCTAYGVHSLLQAQSCDETVVVNGCTINGKNGVAFKQVKAATVEGTTITALEYGIRFDGNTDNYGITVKNNEVTATQPLIVRKMTGKNNTITLEGTNTLTTEAEYQIVITNGSDDEEYVKPTGTYTLTGADAYSMFPALPVAKVGDTEYTSIDEAIAHWTNNSTLTLLKNITLSDVITLKSTEHHILNLDTYTMTAAEGKNAIVIQACGTGDAERNAITINANTENPGGINAGNKCVVYYKYADGGISVNDRPIIKINGGIFTGSTSSWGTAGIYTIGTAARKCATINICGGIFNCSINGSSKSKLLISGGVFNYSVGSQGDSTALRLISGGKFKTLGFMTADENNTKFWFGTSMAVSDVGLYIDDDNYLVVGGPVITEFGDKFAAKATNVTKWSSYLQYSSAAEQGLYYTNAEAAIAKHGEANVVRK